jgi:hypothetical protein
MNEDKEQINQSLIHDVIDLRTCKYGDILITKFGTELRYLKPTEEGSYYDHEVEYLKNGLGNGTRTHEGFVFRKNRRSDDEDVVEIIRT